MRHRPMRSVLLAVALIVCTDAQAATYCAASSAQLLAALESAHANGESDTIRVTAGTFTGGATGFVASVEAGESLTLEGGWLSVFGDCNLPTGDAELTVLDGEHERQSLRAQVADSGSFAVRNMTFHRGHASSDEHDRGGGLYVAAGNGDGGTVLVERNVFRESCATALGGGAYVTGRASRITIRDNLFVSNAALHAAALYVFGDANTTRIADNEMTLNRCTSPGFTSPDSPSGGIDAVNASTSRVRSDTKASQREAASCDVVFIANEVERSLRSSLTPGKPNAGAVAIRENGNAGN